MMSVGSEGALVRLEGVTKMYPAGGKTFRAVNDVSMPVAEGEFVLMLGPSGGPEVFTVSAAHADSLGQMIIFMERPPGNSCPSLRS